MAAKGPQTARALAYVHEHFKRLQTRILAAALAKHLLLCKARHVNQVQTSAQMCPWEEKESTAL
eukprot:1160944-Pelagomonas_calceolata.AAC.8